MSFILFLMCNTSLTNLHMQTEWNDYDNSFMILLFSLFSFVIWFAAAVVCMRNVVNVYELQMQAQQGKHINTFVEDLREYLDKKFHIRASGSRAASPFPKLNVPMN